MKKHLIVLFAFLITVGLKAQTIIEKKEVVADTVIADYSEDQEYIAEMIGDEPKEKNLSDYQLKDNLDYPTVKTSLGNLYVLPEYLDMTDEARKIVLRSNDPKSLYIITNDNKITRTNFLVQPLSVDDKIISFLSFDEPNEVIKNIKENDTFIVTAFGERAESSLNEKLDALAGNKPFTKKDLDQLGLYPIATADGKVLFNGVEGFLICRKVSDFNLEADSLIFVIEVTNVFLEIKKNR